MKSLSCAHACTRHKCNCNSPRSRVREREVWQNTVLRPRHHAVGRRACCHAAVHAVANGLGGRYRPGPRVRWSLLAPGFCLCHQSCCGRPGKRIRHADKGTSLEMCCDERVCRVIIIVCLVSVCFSDSASSPGGRVQSHGARSRAEGTRGLVDGVSKNASCAAQAPRRQAGTRGVSRDMRLNMACASHSLDVMMRL